MELGDFLEVLGIILILSLIFTAIWMVLGPIWIILTLIALLTPLAKAYYCYFYKFDTPIGTCPSCRGTLYLHHREIKLLPPKVKRYGICRKCGSITEVEKK